MSRPGLALPSHCLALLPCGSWERGGWDLDPGDAGLEFAACTVDRPHPTSTPRPSFSAPGLRAGRALCPHPHRTLTDPSAGCHCRPGPSCPGLSWPPEGRGRPGPLRARWILTNVWSCLSNPGPATARPAG